MKVLEGSGHLQPGLGWHRRPGLQRLVAGLEIAQPARTRAMLLLTLFGASAVAAIRLYPGPIAILFCLLMAAGCVVPLRARALPSMALATVGVAALALGRLASEGTASAIYGGALRDGSLWGGMAAGAALLLGSALLAVATSRALALPAAAAAIRRAARGVEAPRAVLSADAGLRRVEWELARAAHYRRHLTLCLLGFDDREAGEQTSEPATSMRRVDRFLLHELSRFEVVAERGAARRLLVLPEVWADGFGVEAERLCRLAGQRSGRPVRAAMVTFPFDGTRLADLLDELELSLGRCWRESSDQARESGQATGFAS